MKHFSHSLLLVCVFSNAFATGEFIFSAHQQLANHAATDSTLHVVTNFEGGSAEVLELDAAAQRVRIRPAGDSTRGMPNWWYLRIDNLVIGKPLLLEVVQKDVLLTTAGAKIHRISPEWTWPAQAVFSPDGETWMQTAFGERQGNQMLYRIEPNSKTIWLAWGRHSRLPMPNDLSIRSLNNILLPKDSTLLKHAKGEAFLS